MSYIQSPYFLLYQLGRSFGLPRLERKRDIEKLSARRGTKSEEISGAVVKVVAEVFELDAQASRDLGQNLQEHLNLYLDLEADIWTFDADQRLVDWTLANHFYISVVARMMAFWYLDVRNDGGMPDGKFWYLPESKNGPDGPLDLPVANVVNWLLDLLGASPDGLVERRADDLRDEKIDARAYDDEEVRDLAQRLYKWKNSSTLPKLETIDKYFPDDLNDQFTDALRLDPEQELDEMVAQIIAFCQSRRNVLTPNDLLAEIDMRARQAPLDSRIVAVFEGRASTDEKMRFVRLMTQRYQAPVTKTVRQRLKVARASQDIFMRCKKYFSEDKARQLIELYKFVYNVTIDAEPEGNMNWDEKWARANKTFMKKIGPMRLGVLSLYENFDNAVSAPVFLKNRLMRIFIESEGNPDLIDFFSQQGTNLGCIWTIHEAEIEETLDWYRQAFDRASSRREVDALDDLWRLFRIAQDDRIDDTIRHSAIGRLNALTQRTRLSDLGLIVELRMARAAGNEIVIERIRAHTQSTDDDHVVAPILLMQLGEHALSCRDFESAQTYFRGAAKVGKDRLSGNMRGELALHLWSLRRHLGQKANSSQEKAWENDVKSFAFEVFGMFEPPSSSTWYDRWRSEYL